MFTKKIIPCLFIDEKKRESEFLETIGEFYNKSGVSEIIFYDVNACCENRKTSLSFVSKVSKHLDIPFGVGGGVSSIYDFSMILKHGAKKVVLNSSAVKNPGLIKQASLTFGSNAVVLYIDTKKNSHGVWDVYIKGGNVKTNLDAIEWAKKGAELGAGEIIINTLEEDKESEAVIKLISKIDKNVDIPVVLSGSNKELNNFYEIAKKSKIDKKLNTSILNIDIKNLFIIIKL